VGSGVFAIVGVVWELDGLLPSPLWMIPWNREEPGVGDPDSTPGPFRIGGVTGRSGLLRVVLWMSENVDWTGCIGWFE